MVLNIAPAGKPFAIFFSDNTPGKPLILEYVDATNYRNALGRLRAALQQAGLHATATTLI